MTEQRRHDRYQLTLSAVIERGKRQIPCQTADISLSGLFLRIDTPPPMRELVKVQVDLQDGHAPIQLMGMAVRVLQPGNPFGKAPGVGVQLFGVDPETLSRWAKFLGSVRKRSGRPSDPVPLRASLPAAKPRTPELRIQPRGREELEMIYHRACLGPIQVRTDVYLDAGRDVKLCFVHPETKKTMTVDGRVLARVTQPQAGISVQVALDQKRRAELSDFVYEEIYITIDLDIDEPSLRPKASNA